MASISWARPLVEHPILTYRPQEWSTPAIGPRGEVYVGASSGLFAAFAPDGRRLWAIAAGGAVSSRPVLDAARGVVYFGADDGRLYAVSAKDGRRLWSYATRGTVNRAPALAAGLIFFTTNEDRIYALEAARGAWRWQYGRPPPKGFTMHGYAGAVVVVDQVCTGFSDGRLVCLRATTGDVLWTRDLSEGRQRFVDVDATPVLAGGHLVAASYGGGLFALDPERGALAWHRPLQGVTAVSVSAGRLLVAATSTLHAFDLKGRPLWDRRVRSGVLARPAPFGGGRFVAATGTEAPLYLARAATGRLLAVFNPGGGISAPAATGAGRLAFVSNRGVLYVFAIAAPFRGL